MVAAPRLRALDRKLARDVWRRRGQVLAIALVIAAAVATLVMALSALRSLSDAREAYYEDNRFAHVFAGVKRAPESVAARLRSIPGVARVDTRVVRYATLEIPGNDEPLRGLVISLPSDNATALNALVLRRGNWPSAAHDNEVLLHEAFAIAHGFGPGSHLTAILNGHALALTVTGIALSPEHVYVIGPGDLVPDDRRFGVLWMNRRALAAASNYEGAFDDVSLLLRRGASIDAIVERVDAALSSYGGAGAYGRDEQLSNAFLDSEFDQLQSMARVVPPIFLLVSAFLLYTVIARQIETQREEIGLLKAFGYSDSAVAWHFVKFALLVCVLGLLLGWTAGAWFGQQMTELYRDYFRFPTLRFSVTADVLLLSGIVAAVAACGGAVAATRRAVRLAPAVAMSPPAPTLYRRGQLEQLGLTRGITASGQMILRHILRFPLRSGMTVLGIALSSALLIATLQFFDSIELMIDSFFFQAQRQDVTLRFTELRADGVHADVARLPGVLRAELRRTVGVKLRHGPRVKRVAVLGVDDGALLSRQVDARDRPIALPPSGIVLSRRLAAHLDATVGDRIRVEVLEGRRAVADVRIQRVIDEYVGLAAYMRRDALDRLTGDGAVADSAWLQVDAHNERALFATVRRAPGVFGVGLQRQAYEKFRAMLDENMVVMIMFYVGFAAVLALGVAYNASRITLSERAHELATLRVLGYHAHEVALILLGELAVLTLLALAVGCVLGYGMAALMIHLFTTDLYQMPFALAPATYGWASVVVTASAACSCAIVAWRVRNLDLVHVLKARD